MRIGPAHQDQSDQHLVDAAAAGDVGAFEVLYRRHRDFVYRIALRFAGSHEGALDASQEGFAHLLRKLPTLRLSGKLSTYLYPVAKNTALAARERDRRRLRLAQEQARPVEHEEAAAPERARLMRAVDALPDVQREVLLMRIVDEMSVEEVALALGVPEGTVKSRLHHAVGVLRGDEGLRKWFEG